MDHHAHPHLGSGMSFASAGLALLGGISVRTTDLIASHASAWSFDDVKWGISLAVSCVFGAIGVYVHLVERMDKARHKRESAELRARLEREAMEADARRRQELADAEARITIERIDAEIRRRLAEGALAASSAPAPAAG